MGMKRCATPYCRKPARDTHRLCSRCNNRRWAQRNPLRYAYGNLRRRARQRGHAFELTFEQYRQFAVQTGYDQLKGKHGKSLSIDRIDPSRGYRMNNIRAVTLSENSRLKYSSMPGWMKEEYEKELAKTSHEIDIPAHDCF